VTAVPPGLPVFTVTLAGGVTVGGVVSTTVTSNVTGGFALPSTQLTVVVPSGNVDPDPGVHM
jgi:hypothetical protein